MPIASLTVREHALVAALAVTLSVLAPIAGARAQNGARSTHVLVLYQQQAETRPMVEFGDRLRRSLRAELGTPAEFYQESLDFDRFTGREDSSPLKSYFEDKYRGRNIDVIVPVGRRALRFAVDRLRGIFPGTPIVFALCVAPQTDAATLPAGVTGRLARASRFEPTLELARRLQPDAERVVVIGGAGQADSTAIDAAVRAAEVQRDHLPVVIMQGLSLDTLLQRAREIPRRSIVVFANYRMDGQGQTFDPVDIVGSIARATSAPMYTQLRSYVGEGVVGGAVTRFDDEGDRTAQLVARVLHRRAGEPIPAVEPIENTFVVDWRQLRRWSLDERLVIPGSEIVSRELSPWERYRTAVLLTLALIGAEMALIASLVVERSRRKRAQSLADERQREADETRRQVAQMGRLAVIGELAATIAHELRQPLAAIRTNAETGAKLVNRGTSAHGSDERRLCREIFTDIITDDQRASDIISRVRMLVRGENVPLRPIDLNEVCRRSVRLLQHEASDRRAELLLSLDPELPAIASDGVQLQQVVLNLVMNALDASASSPSPRVTIATFARDDDVEIVVSDNGPGIPPDVRQHLFDSFFTTKPEGLGLGLAIVRSIVERHHGQVRAVNRTGEDGAAFHIVIPRNNRVRTHTDGARREPVVAESIEGVDVPRPMSGIQGGPGAAKNQLVRSARFDRDSVGGDHRRP